MDLGTLLCEAEAARARAYAPYSGFRVGAALLASDGRIFHGCNIENASFSVTNCAERTALFKAVSEGVRSFSAIAVVGGRGGEPDAICTPCGVCRQALAEFCSPTMPVVLGNAASPTVLTLGELLPLAFSGEAVREERDE